MSKTSDLKRPPRVVGDELRGGGLVKRRSCADLVCQHGEMPSYLAGSYRWSVAWWHCREMTFGKWPGFFGWKVFLGFRVPVDGRI